MTTTDQTRTKRPRNPNFHPTEEQRRFVSIGVAAGVTLEQLASVILHPISGKPLSRQVLAKHFSEEVRTGAIKANVAVANSLFKMAVNGNVAAAIFWLKAKMRWRERDAEEVSEEQERMAIMLRETVLGLREAAIRGDARPAVVIDDADDADEEEDGEDGDEDGQRDDR